MHFMRYAAALAALGASGVLAQPAPPAPKLKDELRMPWTRGETDFVRQWLVAGPVACTLSADCFGGEAGLRPVDGAEQKRADGTSVKWRAQKAWADELTFDDMAAAAGEQDIAYASATIKRKAAGKALLSVGSADGVRVWLNGTAVLSRDGLRSATPDEDQVEVDMMAGDNVLLFKTSARGRLYARVLEPGTVLPRVFEIGPSIVEMSKEGLTLKTDIGTERKDAESVKVEVVTSGGKVVFTTSAARGAKLAVDARAWADGPYEVRCTTHRPNGLLYATHLPWYKGESLTRARELAATAAAADASKPEGITLRMLADMVEDRLGTKLADAKGNPWKRIHASLMEYDELMLERKGQTGRIRPHGFVRLAYRDDVDGSPQFCRAYLPAAYDPSKKWPVVIQIHGYNPANPVYVRWWAADQRHPGIDTEFSDHQGVIYMEPHGRGNTSYLGMGHSDVITALAEAKRLFGVDADRVYLTGDSMGGWGTWNVATRRPDLFAAIAPVFGGSDYRSQMSEEELGRLSPVERFLREAESSWALAEGLLNVPILIHHGDADAAVNVEYSRWAMRLLQRWGYDVRYHEYPGKVHEALGSHNANLSIEWFLQHKRNPAPRQVRIRSAQLRYAEAYWVRVRQANSSLEFMRVDAEVVDRNVVRLDTENVLALDLTLPPSLVDAARPVRVIWNGAAQERRLENASLRLVAAGYQPGALEKSAPLPGAMADFAVTPFAVVVGTVSKDPDMVALCAQKAKAIGDSWREWQKQPLRVFEDTKISEADMARYSLLLIGGPEANSVTAKLAPRIPLQISTEKITIAGQTFEVKDAAVQMLYPNPLNPERYVWIAAGSSTDGMYFCEPSPQSRDVWDFIVTDGRFPAYRETASPLQTRIASGVFDHSWRFDASLVHRGDASIREKGRLRHRPKAGVVIDPKRMAALSGRYQIESGPLVEVLVEGGQLKLRQVGGGRAGDLVPETETSFSVPAFNLWISFKTGADGKVTGLVGYQNGDFDAAKIE